MHRTLISVAQLAAEIGNPTTVVVDCRFSLDDTDRGRRDYALSHVPTAVYAHLDNDLSGPIEPGVTGRHPLPDVQRLSDQFTTWGIRAGVQVVAYDDAGGAIASRLWWLLRWLGHDDVAVLDGGWPKWVADDGRVTAGMETHEAAVPPFAPRLRADLVVDTRQVAALAGSDDSCLMDARGADRFRGENETIDPVAGHIPGAVSQPYADNLREDDTFRPVDELRAMYDDALAGLSPSRAVVYCGSGVTGAHGVLAMAHAGLDGARLYAGSWSKWITDPTRPVSTGE